MQDSKPTNELVEALNKEQVANEPTPWTLHLGPLSFGSHGFDVKPQLKLGGQYGNFIAESGFSDIRDGVKFDMGCRAFVDANGCGATISEAHSSVTSSMKTSVSTATARVSTLVGSFGVDTSCVDRFIPSSGQTQDVLGDSLQVASRVLGSSGTDAYSRLDQIAKSMGIDMSELQQILAGRDVQATGEPITLTVRSSTGMGVSGQMCLGWTDSDGYNMVGVGAKATSIVAMGLEVFAGKHSTGTSIKIVLGIGNFTLVYTFPRFLGEHRDAAQLCLADLEAEPTSEH